MPGLLDYRGKKGKTGVQKETMEKERESEIDRERDRERERERERENLKSADIALDVTSVIYKVKIAIILRYVLPSFEHYRVHYQDQVEVAGKIN